MVYSLIELIYKNKPDVFSQKIYIFAIFLQDIYGIINENWIYQKVETPALLFFIIIMTDTWSFLRRIKKAGKNKGFYRCLNKEKKDKGHLVEYLIINTLISCI